MLCHAIPPPPQLKACACVKCCLAVCTSLEQPCMRGAGPGPSIHPVMGECHVSASLLWPGACGPHCRSYWRVSGRYLRTGQPYSGFQYNSMDMGKWRYDWVLAQDMGPDSIVRAERCCSDWECACQGHECQLPRLPRLLARAATGGTALFVQAGPMWGSAAQLPA